MVHLLAYCLLLGFKLYGFLTKSIHVCLSVISHTSIPNCMGSLQRAYVCLSFRVPRFQIVWVPYKERMSVCPSAYLISENNHLILNKTDIQNDH
jgi:hypothetical protein